MIDPISTASACVSMVSNSINAIKSLIDSGRASSVNSVLLPLKEQMLSIVEEREALKRKVTLLENEICQMREWKKEERDKYALTRVAPHAFVYVAKEEASAAADGPWFCQPCCDQSIKVILPLSGKRDAYAVHRCPRCGSEIFIKVPTLLSG